MDHYIANSGILVGPKTKECPSSMGPSPEVDIKILLFDTSYYFNVPLSTSFKNLGTEVNELIDFTTDPIK